MNTWGEVIESLLNSIRDAGNAAYSGYYGTSRYFSELHLLTHRAFDRWCEEKSIAPELRGKMLEDVKSYATMYRPLGFYRLQLLWKTLPDEFNVRGKWTSEFLR